MPDADAASRDGGGMSAGRWRRPRGPHPEGALPRVAPHTGAGGLGGAAFHADAVLLQPRRSGISAALFVAEEEGIAAYNLATSDPGSGYG